MKQEEGRLKEDDLRLKARPEDSAGCRKEVKPIDSADYRKHSREILPVTGGKRPAQCCSSPLFPVGQGIQNQCAQRDNVNFLDY